jgi:hypothetical protein
MPRLIDRIQDLGKWLSARNKLKQSSIRVKGPYNQRPIIKEILSKVPPHEIRKKLEFHEQLRKVMEKYNLNIKLYEDNFYSYPIEEKKTKSFFNELDNFLSQTVDSLYTIDTANVYLRIFQLCEYNLDLLKDKRGKYIRFQNIYNTFFGKQKFIDFIKSRIAKRKIEEKQEIKDKNIMDADDSQLFRKGNSVYRNMSKEKYELWKKLFDLGLSVEPIENAIDNKDKIIVKSKIVGEAIEYINLDESQKISVFRQALQIMLKLWKLGYVHGHPHPGNFTVVFEKGIPKVTLIDFDKIDYSNSTNLTYDIFLFLKYFSERGFGHIIQDQKEYRLKIHRMLNN